MICLKCGVAYRWVYRARKWLALNVGDDANHWATCPDARRKSSHRKAQRNNIRGQTVSAPQYVVGCGKCSVPPWEVCDCSFQWAKDGLAVPPSRGVEEVKPSPWRTASDRLNAEADKRLQLALLEETA